MLKVINSKIVSKIKVKIDEYVPLSFQCLDLKFQPLLYWRTGNFKNYLLEIGILPDDGTLVKIKMPLAGKTYQITNHKEIEKLNKINSIKGLPIVDMSNLKLINIEDEKREIKVSIGKNSLIIYCKEHITPTKVFYVDHVKFGVDPLGDLILIAFFDIPQSDILKMLAFQEIKENLE